MNLPFHIHGIKSTHLHWRRRYEVSPTHW